jgi:hypothetical protein
MASPTFGSYTLPGAIQTTTDDVAAELSTWKPSGKPGQGSVDSLLSAKRVSIQGIVNYTSLALRDAGWEAIKAGLPVGPQRALVVSSATPARYFEARVEQLTRSLNPQFPFRLVYDATFFVGSGVALASSLTTQTLTTSGGTVSSVGGTEPALPTIEISLSTAGSIVITNSTTNEAISLTATATGTIYLDSAAETITRVGNDVSSEWTAGQFLSFAAGVANTLSIATSGDAVVSGLAISYRARWR